MKLFTSGEKAAIRGGEYATAEFLHTVFPEGTFGFWTGTSPITDAGVTFVPGANFIEVEAQGAGVDISARTLQITLRGNTRAGLTPDVLSSINSYAYKNAPTWLARGWFARSTGLLVKKIILHRGYIDTIAKVRQKMGREMNLVAVVEPKSIDHSRIGYRVRSPEDQKLVASGDTFFDRAALTPRLTLPYGRDALKVERVTSAGGGGKFDPGGSR